MKTRKEKINSTDSFIDYVNQNSDFYEHQIPIEVKDEYLLGNSDNQISTPHKATLKFNEETGEITYTTKLGKTYQNDFRRKSDAYNLINFLINNRRESYSLKVLAKAIAGPAANSETLDNEGIVRSAKSYLKKKLKFKKNEEFILCKNREFSLIKDLLIME